MLDLQSLLSVSQWLSGEHYNPRAFTTMGGSLVLSSFSPPTGVAGCWASCDCLSVIPTSTGRTMALTLDCPALWNPWEKSWASGSSTELLCKYQCVRRLMPDMARRAVLQCCCVWVGVGPWLREVVLPNGRRQDCRPNSLAWTCSYHSKAL